MESEGETTGELSVDVAQVGVGRTLLVGGAAWLDDLASALDDLDVAVEAEVTTAQERFTHERFDCVLVAADVPHAEALGLLATAREFDTECATILVVAGPDETTETAADAAAVTEVVLAGDGDGWRFAVVSLVRQATERVRVSRRVDYYEGLAAGMADFVIVLGADAAVRYVSPSIETITGVLPAEIFEVGPFSLVHPDDAPDLVDAFEGLVAAPEGSTDKAEFKARHADGTWRIHEVVATNRLADPRIEGIVANVRDITDPPRATDRATEGLDRLTDAFFALDTDWRFTYANEPAADLLGYPAEDLLGANIWELFPDAKDLAFYEQYRHAVKSGEPVAFEERYGDEHFEIRAYPSETGISVYLRDVSERRATEQKFQAVFERAIDAIAIADDDGRYVDVNPAACDLFGLPSEELLGRSIAEFASEDFDFETVWQAFTDSTHERGTFELVRPDGTERVVEFSASLDVLPDWHLSVMRDVTERHRFERELQARTERLRTIVENVPVILFVLDEDGTYTLSEGKGLAALESEPGEVVGTSIYDRYGDQPAVIEDFHRALDGEQIHCTVEFHDIVFETSLQPVANESGAIERVIGVSMDITERTRHEHTLRALHDSTRGLLGMDTEQTIADHLVETAIEVLDFPGVVVYCFDEAENVLRPTAASDDGTDILGEPPVLGGDEPSITWQAFVTGNPEILDDVRTSEYVYDDETSFRSGLYVPLGAHGVLVVGSPEVGAFDDRTHDLADLLAATGEAALDRVDRESALRERDQKFQRQNRQLRRLNRVNKIIREIDTALVQAENRSEIERAVTERLTETDQFSLAWIGEVDADGEHLRPRAWSGIERGYLDTVADDDTEPAAQAAHDSEVALVENVAAELRTESWRTEALARNYQSALAVPLVHDGFSYGALTVYATRPWAFDATIQSALEQIGTTIAYAIDAVERKHALLSDDVTELKFEIADDNCLFHRLARQADCRLILEGFHTRGKGIIAFVTIEGASLDRFVATATESTAVEDVSTIRVDEDAALVELHLPVAPLATGMLDRGVVLTDLVSHPSGSRAIMVAPGTVNARSVVETVETMFPDSEFLARRERTRPPGGEREARQRLLDRLTDRQREVLQVAYHGGYFESPRTTTGGKLATALGVSPPAFHGHLRSVQRKVFATLLEADTEGLTD